MLAQVPSGEHTSKLLVKVSSMFTGYLQFLLWRDFFPGSLVWVKLEHSIFFFLSYQNNFYGKIVLIFKCIDNNLSPDTVQTPSDLYGWMA